MSILPPLLMLVLGVASARHFDYPDGGAVLRPIATRSEERRICAELCMSGLGGDACGQDCVDLTPQGLPLQSATDAATGAVYETREVACPVLCRNRLGFPLCDCDAEDAAVNRRPDFVEVCGHFCTSFQYHIYGCQECELYRNATASWEKKALSLSGKTQINWNFWCQIMCQTGDGGAACNCDLLPMRAKV